MKIRLLLASLVLAFSACALPAAGPNQLTSAEKSAGWNVLFDGQSLAGWRGYKEEAPGAGWSVKDGVLVTAGKAGDLVTQAEFGDFELSLDWNISEGGNSGIIFRVGLGDNATYTTGPEIQILDDVKAEDNKKDNHLAGSLYDLVAPPKGIVKPAGEWNSARLIVRGWHIQSWLNGQKTVDLDLASPEGKALVAGSKFKTWAKFATLSRGRIALQDHGYAVSFRNVKIRELK